MISFIDEAIKQAENALYLDEVPVGAVIVKDGMIISKAFNLRETTKNPTAHAEILAIQRAAEILGDWRLTGCHMYVTLEPCPMCAGAIVQARIPKLYIGTFDPRTGACGSVMNIVQDTNLNHHVNVEWLYNQKCSDLLQIFFENRRKKHKLIQNIK